MRDSEINAFGEHLPEKKVHGIKRYFEPKTGRWYCYHRATKKRIKAQYGTADFHLEVAAISCERSPCLVKVPGTWGALVADYRASHVFKNLAVRTQSDYQAVFDYLSPLDTTPVARFTTGTIVKLRDKALSEKKRRFANYVVAVLSLVFEYGREREMVAVNPVKGVVRMVRRPKGMTDANRPWTSDERDAVLAEAPPHLKVPIALAMFVGLREADALKIGRERYDGRNISTTTSKAGTFIWWRCPMALKAILDEALIGSPPRRHANISFTSRGEPWTSSGFRASWRTFRQRLEKDQKIGMGLTIHGLRHTVATTLREEGFEPRMIADALGQKTVAMAEHYSKNADLKKKMEGVADAIDRRLGPAFCEKGKSEVTAEESPEAT